MLKMGLEHAVRQGYIARNVAKLVPPVRMDKPEIHPLDRAAARALLEASASDRDAALYALVLFSGQRQGEALGLHWADVDLDGRTVHVRQQYQHGAFTPLKRGASRRILSLHPWVADVCAPTRRGSRSASSPPASTGGLTTWSFLLTAARRSASATCTAPGSAPQTRRSA
jgi:integrase